jgi:hypothetical protein
LKNAVFQQTVRKLLTINNTIFAGTQSGIFLSADNGENWKSGNDGLESFDIISLNYDKKYIYCTTNYEVYRASLSYFGITDVEVTKPLQESELMIYPNPAGDYIEMNVETHGRASLLC